MFRHNKKQSKPQRIGIYAGTFNPVHVGHIAFALQAMKAAKLDRLYFLPERRPRHKQGVEHFGHRVAMLSRAIRPYPAFGVLEITDVSFSVDHTLPKLSHSFKGSQLVFLMGSDTAQEVANWPKVEHLMAASEIVVGLRAGHNKRDIEAITKTWPSPPKRLVILQSHAPEVSSRTIREALAARRSVHGLLKSVAQYSNRHWLYVSLSKVMLDKA